MSHFSFCILINVNILCFNDIYVYSDYHIMYNTYEKLLSLIIQNIFVSFTESMYSIQQNFETACNNLYTKLLCEICIRNKYFCILYGKPFLHKYIT